MVEPYTLGFNDLHGSGGYHFEMISTMAKWVFGYDIGNQLVPLMHLGFHGSPNLGLAHNGLVISLRHLEFGLGSEQWKCRQPLDLKGKLRLGYHACDFVLFRSSHRGHTSHY